MGRWLKLPPGSACKLGDSPNTGTLGATVILGSCVWTCQLHFRLRMGPMKLVEFERRIDAAEAAGFPVFDHFEADSLSFTPGTGLAHNSARVDRLGPGLAYLITHCAEGGPELESITRDWRQRDEEHRIYSDGSMADEMKRRGIRTSGMRPLRERLNAKLR